MPRQSAQPSTTNATVRGFPDVQNRTEFQIIEIEREIYENKDRPLSGVLKGVIERVRLLTGAEGAFIALGNAWGVVCRASAGDAPVVGSRLQDEPSLTRECLESGQVVISGDTEEALAATSSQLHSVVVVPVLGQGSVLGLVEILSSRTGAFTTEHIAQLQRIAHLLVPILQREEATQPAQKRGKTGVWTAVCGTALVLLLLFLWFEFYHRPRAASSPPASATASTGGNSAELPTSERTAGETQEAQGPGTSPSAQVATPAPPPQSGAGPAAAAPSEQEGIGTTRSLPPPKTKAQPKTVSPASGRVSTPVAAPAIRTLVEPPSDNNKEQPGGIATVNAQPGNQPGAQTNGVSATAATSAPTVPVAVPPGAIAKGSADRPQPGSPSGGDVHEMAASSRAGGHAEDFVELGGVPSGRYFSLGKFKDEPGAQESADGLTKAGFHSVVVHEAGFWTTSYHVLAGPYSNEPEAEAARRKLKSDGFSPRNLPQKSRTLFLLPKTFTSPAAFKPVGSLVVAWEAYSSNAIVKFVKDGKVVATAQAKWVERSVPYQHDEIAYRETDQGSRALLEIHFSGARQALVVAQNGEPIVF